MITDVVAALIWNGDRFLACQRSALKARGMLWEMFFVRLKQSQSVASIKLYLILPNLSVQ